MQKQVRNSEFFKMGKMYTPIHTNREKAFDKEVWRRTVIKD